MSSPVFPENLQIVVFASEGLTRSVEVRVRPPDGEPCIVVDYDERKQLPFNKVEQDIDDFERELLGCTRAEFDQTSTYLW